MSNRTVQHIAAHKKVGAAKHQGFPYRLPFLFATSYSNREVEEEAGVQAKIIQELPPTEYFYQFQKQKIKKKVTYFLMEYISGDISDHDWEMEDAQWIPLDKVYEKLSFKSDKEVFQKAKKLIEK